MQHQHNLTVSLGAVDLVLDELLDVGEDVADVWGRVSEGALDYGLDDVEDYAAGFVVDAVNWAAEGQSEFVEVALHPLEGWLVEWGCGGWVDVCIGA